MTVVDELSNKEVKAIEELQMRVKNCLTEGMRDDVYLYYRFLKARDFDVDKAEKMLIKHILWRKVHQVDTILEDFTPTEFFHMFPEPSTIGYDKDGDLTVYNPTGKFNPHDIMKCVTMSALMKHWSWFGEKNLSRVNAENERTGRKSFQASIIIDLDKLTFANTTARISVNLFLRFINEYQNNYPERMKAAYIINAPSYFVLIFSILKRVMSNAMLRKIHIFGNNGWKEKLLEVIDADVLPAFLGGNRTDPDGNPLCKTFITHGGKIPEYYFLSEQERYFKDESRVKKRTIQPLKKEEIHVELKNLGSILQWEFFVKDKDIGFGILFVESEHKVTEIIPMETYATPDGSEKDSLKCRSIGKYIIVFDNSHSWMNSKEVQYCITIVNP